MHRNGLRAWILGSGLVLLAVLAGELAAGAAGLAAACCLLAALWWLTYFSAERLVLSALGARPVTEVERLDREGRIVELAQMLGSGGEAAAGLAAARELLDRAEAWRGASATAR